MRSDIQMDYVDAVTDLCSLDIEIRCGGDEEHNNTEGKSIWQRKLEKGECLHYIKRIILE